MFSKIVVAFFAVLAVAFAAPAAKPGVLAYGVPAVSTYSAYTAPVSAYSAYAAPVHSAYSAYAAPAVYSAGYTGLPVAGYSAYSAHVPAVYY